MSTHRKPQHLTRQVIARELADIPTIAVKYAYAIPATKVAFPLIRDHHAKIPFTKNMLAKSIHGIAVLILLYRKPDN